MTSRTPSWSAALLAALVLIACGAPDPSAPGPAAVTAAADAAYAHLPAPMRACAACHADVVEQYLGHGMAQSLGPVDSVTAGRLANPVNGMVYELTVESGGAFLRATTPGGGQRVQRLVGRIGAGIFDTSWAAEELDPFTYESTGRLFFAPVEQVAGRGLELSPFEQQPPAQGVDFGLTEGCLTCHTTDDPARLPGAAAGPDGQTVYPGNALGADAFAHLNAIGCDGCHGDARRHVEIMSGLPTDDGDLGLPALGDWPAPRQRDVCARCHLQGDARLTLADVPTHPATPLAGLQPALVPVRAGDDFRFVGQLERLALSACFKESPAMTCTTCHDPHSGVRDQGTASFDAACQSCHEDLAHPTVARTAEQIAGAPARTSSGCVDCHVRRSQPFDLPHVRAADHFIRARIPRPEDDLAHRAVADPGGPLDVFDDGRLAGALATPEGRRWREGVLAMGLASLGRFGEAARSFDAFPPPGTFEAFTPTAPEGLVPLETSALFHRLRGIVLMNTGRPDAAAAALTDALDLDPTDASARLDRAQLRVLAGDLQGALDDTERIIGAHPAAEQPWNLRAVMALRLGSAPMAASALEASTAHWPSDAAAWLRLGRLYQQIGRTAEAQQALDRARRLRPSVFEEVASGR